MVKDSIKIHDQFAFELKLEYPAISSTNKKDDFNFEMFLFLPHSLDVNKHNFLRGDFYRALKMNIRLTTPFFKLEELIEKEDSPLVQVEESIAQHKMHSDDLTLHLCRQQIKRYCSIFGSALRYASGKISQAKDMDERNKLILLFIEQIEYLRDKYHNLQVLFNNQPGMQELLREYRFADEYQSLLVESNIFTLITYLQNKKVDHKANIEHLYHLVEKEMDFRDANDYPSVTKPNRSNEDVLHRKSRLKKYIESNLFLNTQTRQEGVIAEQILFSIAAGLAMVFATAIAFATQLIYDTLTIPFFVALVVSYMFKDRIKEWARVYLDKKHKKIHADFKTTIFDQEEDKMGYLRESFHFENKNHLPEMIIKVRETMRATEMGDVGTVDNIIGYKNKTTLLTSALQKDKYSGITQILRFNISDFTRKMDDPEKEVFVRTNKGIKRMLAERVYYLNLILQYKNSESSEIKCYKIKASRNGIKKIELYKNSGFTILNKK